MPEFDVRAARQRLESSLRLMPDAGHELNIMRVLLSGALNELGAIDLALRLRSTFDRVPNRVDRVRLSLRVNELADPTGTIAAGCEQQIKPWGG